MSLVPLGLAVLLAGCSYDPHPAEGKLQCSSSGECPQGYTCDPSANACFSHPPDLTTSSSAADYIGDWAFGPAATVTASCDDGSTESASLADKPNDPANRSIMNIVAGSAGLGDLQSSWLCDLSLDLDATGAHLGGGAHDCAATRQATDPITAPQTQMWTATLFDLNVPTRDRTQATHTAKYTRVDTYLAGTKVTCEQTVHAALKRL